ncbi:Inositol 2-dehydrogenase [Anaerohalosphaera lusitana]|uniref:Inositol 2-dehydrogenase n=1 Tax=Anaerohalosphaera lusitana TaxID=1936003 RepID=A0A1U9NN98_9BACT|nr:Gfo/Idh/MocA family oxidoreductase [Anaerohalosphaera lusitana]AQT69277.1 Inositol 2-dehydrogenase [Anaerohalosphaera lusitana]
MAGHGSKSKDGISRRQFMGSAAAAAAAFTVVPSYVIGANGQTPPSEKLNIAAIGAGGMGAGNLRAMSGENIVALCDVDDKRAAGSYERFPDAKRYKDFRVMLEKQKDIDAVLIATPDHTHAVAAMAAMQAGKHVYVQKPLTYTVNEARVLTEAARKYKVATQMGNQGHSGEGCRLIHEWIHDGAIGPVREVHCWTNRPIWPQGIVKPAEAQEVPSTMDWDLWVGPSRMREYNSAYAPFNWRGWIDYGCGSLGDMGCHIMDAAVYALDLTKPSSVIASVSKDPTGEWKIDDRSGTYPAASVVHYTFPARGSMPPVKLHWYDGGIMPERPEDLEPGRRMPDSGTIFVGDKGKIMSGTYGGGPRIIPETKMRAYDRPERTLERVEGSHEQNWIDACKGGKPAVSNFEYAGPFTEMVLLGNIAVLNPDQRLNWDADAMKITNNEEANAWVKREYRQGWSL